MASSFAPGVPGYRPRTQPHQVHPSVLTACPRAVSVSTRSALAYLFVAVIAVPAVFGAPRVETGECQDTQLRLCSPNFLYGVPIRNSGDEALSITSIRSACKSCVEVYMDRTVIEPGESAQLSFRGSRHEDGPVELICFLTSNDPHEPNTWISLTTTFCSSRYSCTLGWAGGGRKLRYPYERIRVEPIRAGGTHTLEALVEPLAQGSRVESLAVESSLFSARAPAEREGGKLLQLVLLDSGSGVWYDYLRVIVNKEDLLVIPLQVLVYPHGLPRAPEVPFPQLAHSGTTVASLTIDFAEPGQVWGDPVLLASLARLPENAVRILSVRRSGASLSVDVQMDGRLIDRRGPVMIPLTLAGQGETVHFVLYGWVY